MKLGMNTIIYRDEPVENVFSLLGSSGYDGVEIAWVPREHPMFWGQEIDVEKIKGLAKEFNLEVSSICPFYPPPLDLASSEKQTRLRAIEYVRRCIDVAKELKAKVVVVVPSAVFKQSSAPFEQEWEQATQSLKELGPYAADRRIVLAIEPITRFLTPFVNRLDQALKLVADSGTKGLGVMADIFHMNIEESSIEESLKAAKGKLVHVHISDSNNFAPGTGHLNFKEIFSTLKEINYTGYIVAELGVEKQNSEHATHETIEYLRRFM